MHVCCMLYVCLLPVVCVTCCVLRPGASPARQQMHAAAINHINQLSRPTAARATNSLEAIRSRSSQTALPDCNPCEPRVAKRGPPSGSKKKKRGSIQGSTMDSFHLSLHASFFTRKDKAR